MKPRENIQLYKPTKYEISYYQTITLFPTIYEPQSTALIKSSGLIHNNLKTLWHSWAAKNRTIEAKNQ